MFVGKNDIGEYMLNRQLLFGHLENQIYTLRLKNL